MPIQIIRQKTVVCFSSKQDPALQALGEEVWFPNLIFEIIILWMNMNILNLFTNQS